MNPRELIENASFQLSTYKHPDIDEARELIEKILSAAEKGSIQHDHVESMEINDDEVIIETTWSVRCCTNSSTYRFPTYILDAENPEYEAKKWSLEEKLETAKAELIAAEKTLEYAKQKLDKTSTAYQELILSSESDYNLI